MRTRGSVLPSLALVIGLIGSSSAHATYRDLCSSVPRACEFTGPDAPTLAAAVCWSSTTSTVTLMSGSTCPTGSWPYFVKYGLVDLLSRHVTAYVPLDDACSRPGLCVPKSYSLSNGVAAPMCCIGGTCWPIAGTNSCENGELLYCTDGVCNDDGTITCFDEEPG